MKIRIITVGKKNSLELEKLILNYEKRLRSTHAIEWQNLKPSRFDNEQARKVESSQIFSVLPKNTIVWLLDERGQEINNQQLLEKLNEVNITQAKELTIVIGGAYGVNQALREKADFMWSLSKLILPHQLVRLVLVEQLYRSEVIKKGSAYHHI